MIHFIWSILVGLVVGLIACALLPEAFPMGVLATAGIGILGSLFGGAFGYVTRRPGRGAVFHAAGFLMSIVCSIVLLVLLSDVH